VGSLKLQWEQAPLLIILDFEPEKSLIKKGKINIIAIRIISHV
jgi:hypothetical protein